ncbi:glycosyltransferase [Microbacterium sp. NPDC056044]|uniref:glycosyltransferase n=1 Tax=Microbacterium sp. NPDC056044 TaxID=3345690 RepID=UPI0035DABE48
MPAASRSRCLQRILFPAAGDEDAAALYLRITRGTATWTRTSLDVAPGSTVSLSTYFAAFPAAYWQAHTRVASVAVTGEILGSGVVRVCAADETTGRRVLWSGVVSGNFTRDIPLEDGTWFWLELEAGDQPLELRDAQWCADEAPVDAACVCITTHNRGADCVGVLERLASDDRVLERIARVIVVDQGDQPLRDAPGFEAAAAALGDRLRVIPQGNLGGSGGFSRGMLESLGEDADHALLLDDDVLLEPESILRLLVFSSRARGELVVGAQMLSLVHRTSLHSMGEHVTRRGFWWGPVEPAMAPVDLAIATIESTPGLRRRYDVDFNGWWMCLVPLPLVRRIGASLPLFLKWDDAEYGLRAAENGAATVSLPGAALWHMPWTDKDDGLDWQAYYQLRNRVVAALIHSRTARGGGVLSSSFAQDVNHVLCLQYGSVAARRVALRDVLAGPGHLPRALPRRTADIRALMARAGQVVVPEAHLPDARGNRRSKPVQGRGAAARRLAAVFAHQLTRPRSTPDARVDASFTRAEGKWWNLGLVDSATVASATGSGAFVARRDRRTAVTLLRDGVLLRVRLWVRWPRLAREYRQAAPELSSPSAWNAQFAGEVPGTDTAIG